MSISQIIPGLASAPSIAANPIEVGSGGSKIVENSTVFEFKNQAENALVKVRFLDGAASTDGITYAQWIASTGTTSASFQLDNDSSGCSIRTAAGSPESAVTGSIGDIFLRDDGSADTCLYVKESGAASNTGWKAYSSAALVAAQDAYAVRSIKVPIADPAGAYTSTATIPAGSTVVRYDVKYSEVFNNTPTLTIGYTGVLNAFSDTSDTDLTALTFETNNVNIAGDAGTARAIICTVGGTPDQGAAVVTVFYMTTIGV